MKYLKSDLTQKNSKMMIVRIPVQMHNILREMSLQTQFKLTEFINQYFLEAADEKIKADLKKKTKKNKENE